MTKRTKLGIQAGFLFGVIMAFFLIIDHGWIVGLLLGIAAGLMFGFGSYRFMPLRRK